MTTKQQQSSETDIILNRANIALARSQRLVASWLPAPTPEEQLQNPIKSAEELQREEDEIFKAVPETLGVGAPLPTKAADGSWNRTELDSNDKLRKQLLGRNYKKVMDAKNKGNGAVARSKDGSRGKENGADAGKDGNEDEDDDDEGRTALIGKKRENADRISQRKKQKKNEKGNADLPMEQTDGSGNQSKVDAVSDGEDEEKARPVAQGGSASRSTSGSKGRKKATSFLDEILAERSKKRQKR